MVGDDRVRVTVEDAGAGVAEAALASLFVRAGPRPAPAGRGGRGSGIGLVVVRGLVEAMGGTVAAARSALGGLRVDVDVPVAPAVIGATEGAGQGGP
jgi:C4-dicarboxylate-specific signal transduction histidine kinase